MAETYADVAVACLSYLCLRYFDSNITDEEVDLNIVEGGYILHEYSQSNFLHHVRGALRDESGTTEHLVDPLKRFLDARWNPSYKYNQLGSKPPDSTGAVLMHINSRYPEEYKKLNLIAMHFSKHSIRMDGDEGGFSDS